MNDELKFIKFTMIKIPKFLQNPDFRFVVLRKWNLWKSKEGEYKEFNINSLEEYLKLKNSKEWVELGKVPIDEEWQNKNNYEFDNSKISNHPENTGIVAGYGNLRILDIDDKELSELTLAKLNTFTVKTGSGIGRHFYIISDYDINHRLKNKMGEFRAQNQQVVLPGSKHPSGGIYEIEKDVEIIKLSKEELLGILNPLIDLTTIENIETNQVEVDKDFLEKNILPQLGKLTHELIVNEYTKEGLQKKGFDSRSERDQKVITTLILRGLGKYVKSIFNLYPVGDKYKEHPSKDKYLLHNIKEARTYSGVKDDSLFDLEVEIETVYAKVLRNKVDDYLLKISKIKNWIHQIYLINTIAGRTMISKKDLLKRLEEIISGNKIKNITYLGKLMQQDFPDTEYWVNPLIPKNTLILLGGKPGTFKSMFVLSLMITTQISNTFLDNFTIQNKPKILFYDLENGERILWHRLKYLFNGKDMKSEINENFCISYDFDKEHMDRELEMSKNYDIIVLDSYRRFLKGVENESDVTDKFFREYLNKLKEMGKTIIILHHFKKGNLEELDDEDIMDLFRGSSDIPAQFDIAFGLFKSREVVNEEGTTTKFYVNLKKVKNRLGLPIKDFNFEVIKDDINKKTTFVFNEFASYISPKQLCEKRILEILNSRDLATRAELLVILKKEFNLGDVSITRYLRAMVKDAVLFQPKNGVYSLIEFGSTGAKETQPAEKKKKKEKNDQTQLIQNQPTP